MRLVPVDPTVVPSEEAGRQAEELLRRFAPRADEIAVEDADEVRFVDCGENWKGVRCPHCHADLESWWPDAMSSAATSWFRHLTITAPCCGKSTNLAALDYGWPVGFARWSLGVRNADLGGKLTADQHAELERAVGCQLQLVLAMY